MSRRGGTEQGGIAVVLLNIIRNHQKILRRKQHDLLHDFKVSLSLLCTEWIREVQEWRNLQTN